MSPLFKPFRWWKNPVRWVRGKLISWIWRRAGEKCRDVEDDVCCCGSPMAQANAWSCEAACISMRSWAVQLEAERVLKRARQLRLLPKEDA